MKRRLVYLTFVQLITSTLFLQRMNQISQEMKILNAVFAQPFVGTQQSWFTVHSVQESAWADTSLPMHHQLRYMKLVSTTSSADKITQVAEIKSSSKVTHLLECIHAHSSKVALVKISSMDSAKSFHTQQADYLHTHTHV